MLPRACLRRSPAPHYSRPVRYDTTKLERLLGPIERTPLAEAVAVTLDWLTGQRTLNAPS